VRQQHGPALFRRPAVPDWRLGRLDVAVLRLHMTVTIPRSPRIGSRFRGSATEMKAIGTPAALLRLASRAGCSASRSVRAIFTPSLSEAQRLLGLAGERRALGK
jgi:hypothetical protein